MNYSDEWVVVIYKSNIWLHLAKIMWPVVYILANLGFILSLIFFFYF